MQPALIIIAILMTEQTGPNRVWRWNLPYWALLSGYILGFILLPFSRGLDKPRVLKWWLRIDLIATVLLFIPFWFTLAGCEVKYISDKENFVLFNRGGFLSAPHAQLGIKSGPFINSLHSFSVEHWNISDDDWGIDNKTGYCWLKSEYDAVIRLYVCPADSMLYNLKHEINSTRIDSLYYRYAKRIDSMDFVIPDDFSRVAYTDSTVVSYFNADDQWYPSVEIVYTPTNSNISPDSVIVRLKDSTEDIVFSKDSVPYMSPTEVRRFIINLKRR